MVHTNSFKDVWGQAKENTLYKCGSKSESSDFYIKLSQTKGKEIIFDSKEIATFISPSTPFPKKLLAGKKEDASKEQSNPSKKKRKQSDESPLPHVPDNIDLVILNDDGLKLLLGFPLYEKLCSGPTSYLMVQGPLTNTSLSTASTTSITSTTSTTSAMCIN
ncbi:hypothetical protein DFA_11017 [Cavenderia fasciculata]|uniref:Uncharacterized protein n=1 Tax=Cavenderia fasciculata TaxID=261658 RepID=F4QC19_CACFS|nr:uncharacterized protein DFA_11017 [Cavenderia fasciculata]EGG14757.1 hypothetical protein DFA_11017 [Cavenderia fasciculata]|eukprot:XP_004351265.1 hypothetical protein DFA_11017 [Cavenderia fasciculata]